MRTALLLATLLVLAACTAPAEQVRKAQPVDSGPTPRAEPAPQRTITAAEPDLQSNQTWRADSAATLLVSDGRQAARMHLPEGATVANLSLATPTTITVKAVGKNGDVLLIVNDEQQVLREDEDAYFSNDALIVHVSEVII